MALERIASIVAAVLTGLTIIPALVFTALSFRLKTFRQDPSKPWVLFLRAALVLYSIWTIMYTAARGFHADHMHDFRTGAGWQRDTLLTLPVLSHTSTWIQLIAQSLLLSTLSELLFATQSPQIGSHTSGPRYARRVVRISVAFIIVITIIQFGLAVQADRRVYETTNRFNGGPGGGRILYTANRFLLAILAMILLGVVGVVIASGFACARRGRGKYLRRSPVFALVGSVLFAVVLSWDIARASLWLVLGIETIGRQVPVWEPILTAVVRWIMLGVLIMLYVLAKERDSESWTVRRGPKGEMVVVPAMPDCARAGGGEVSNQDRESGRGSW